MQGHISTEDFTNYELNDIVTPIKVEVLGEYLQLSGYDPLKSREILNGFEKGFDIGYRGPMDRQNWSQNLPLTIGTETDIWNKLMKEVKLGRHAGPYDFIPYEHFIQSPIGLVPKDNGKQTRLIFHLSYDFGPEERDKSLNHHTPEQYCKVQYRDLDYAVRTCLFLDLLKSRQHGVDLDAHTHNTTQYYAKSDLRSAFRLLPILPEQRCLLLMRAKDPKTGRIMVFIDKNLPFGASSSCAKFQLFSDCLHHIVEFVMQRRFTVTNYLDDFLFIAMDEQDCNNMVRTFLDICLRIGCPVAMDKTEWASAEIVFLGILLRGRSRTLSLPRDKVIKAINLLHYVRGNGKATIKFIQSLTGTLNFLTKAIVPGRAFTMSMYDKLKTTNARGQKLKQYHHISLNKSFKQDCAMWEEFLMNARTSQLCRPYIDFEKTRFNTKVLNFYTDASLSATKGGFGGVFENRYIVGKWNQDFIEQQQPSIEFLELYALVAGILTWGDCDSRLQNGRLAIFCDNQSVMYMINGQGSKCNQCMKLIRLLTLSNIRNNRRVFVKHVKTNENILADSLSRMNFGRFWKNAPRTMLTYPDVVPSVIWPIENIWFQD